MRAESGRCRPETSPLFSQHSIALGSISMKKVASAGEPSIRATQWRPSPTRTRIPRVTEGTEMRAHCIFLLLGAGLSACGSTSSNTSFVGPSGEQIHSAKCSIASQGCYQEAAKICGGSYQVLDSESHAGGIAADLMAGPVTWYGMTYSCGKSDGRLPAFPFRGQTYVPDASPRTTNCQAIGNSLNCQHY